MLQLCLDFLLILNVFTIVLAKYDVGRNSENAITAKNFVLWPNATVPFFVNPAHFDHEQTMAILTALSMFAFKTCIKFKPVMARPAPTDEVMVFINPDGTKRCHFDTKGHSVFNPHFVKLGYECLKSPQIDMMIMRALGFPFEHNRDSRDLYIEVLNENIEPGNLELFTKQDILPLELRFLPYDVNSVMHFGNRDYSKNGHRTIIFKDSSVKQNHIGLTTTDLKKIEIVYGPECRARDRQEKVELCQSYPGVVRRRRQIDDNGIDDKKLICYIAARKKREIDPDRMATKSLRVNPDITPPPVNQSDEITITLKQLGINEAVDDIVEQVYKMSSLALKNAREKYCNNTKEKLSEDVKVGREGKDIKARNSSDILGIIEVVADFAKGMVERAIQNLTEFCENSEALEVYQRYSCGNGGRDPRCRNTYRSTKSGAVRYSTNHRPIIQQSTNHRGGYKARINYARIGNATENGEELTTPSVRRKRDLETTTTKLDDKNELKTPTSDNTKAAEDKDKKKASAEKKEKVEVKADIEKLPADNKEIAAEVNKENISQNKERAVEEKIEAETDDIKAKPGKMMINNKEILRFGHNRRSQGDDSGHYDASSEDQDNLDTILAKKIIEKKHIIQKNNRKKKSHHIHSNFEENPRKIKNKRHHKMENIENYMAIPIEAYVKNNNSDENIQLDSVISPDKEGDSDTIDTDEEEPKDKEELVKLKQAASDSDENDMTESEDDGDDRTPVKPIRPKERPYVSRDDTAHGLPRTVVLSKKNKDFYDERRWPRGELVYMIQEDTTYDLANMRGRLAEVSDILKERTCVRLKEIKPSEANKYDDYILINNSPDYVTGRVGGKQKFGSIELFRGGQHRQHAAMMVMAMMGFYFEVSRHDRDKFIRVHMRHVRPDKLHHFEKIRSDATLPLPYDYASATHPAWQFWRQIGRAGISTVATYKEMDPDGSIMKSLGQNENVLSKLDIVKINSVYGVDCFGRPRANPASIGLNNDTLPLPQAEDSVQTSLLK